MNTLDDNVVSLRPEGHQSQRWLALGLGNGARQAGASLQSVEESAVALMRSCEALAGLASDAEDDADSCGGLARKLERCMALSHRLAGM